MGTVFSRFSSASADQTARLARQIAPVLRAGDTLLLEGDIGAGKTHFARALIGALQDVPEDVPSPTFTLIQTYDTGAGPVWHADLYRLTSPDEIVETGLLEAMGEAICLIEWPDRLGPDSPARGLTLHFAMAADEDAREISASSGAPEHWADRLERCDV